MKNFGNRIKALRRKMNLTQEELAERLNVSFQTISKWETNASLPDVTMFPLLANFFNVTTDELMGVDLAKKQAKIDEIIEEYNHLSNLGKEKERFDFICQAYREYPNDYKILEKNGKKYRDRVKKEPETNTKSIYNKVIDKKGVK